MAAAMRDMDNVPATGEDMSPASAAMGVTDSPLRSYLAVIRRRRVMIVSVAAVITIMAAAWSLSRDEVFQSVAKLELQQTPALSSLNSPTTGFVSLLATAREKIRTADFLEKILQSRQVAGLTMKPGVADIQKGLEISYPSSPMEAPVLEIRVGLHDREAARRVTDAIADVFRRDDEAERKDRVELRKRQIEMHVAEAQQALDDVKREIAELRVQFENVQIDEEINNLIKLRKEYEAKGEDIRSEIRAKEDTIRDLKTRLSTEERQIVTAVQQGQDPRRQELARLQVELTNSLAQYTNQHPIIMDLKDRIERLKQQIEENTATGNSLETRTYSPNPTRQVYQTQIVQMEGELQALKARKGAAETSLESFATELRRLSPVLSDYLEKDRERQRRDQILMSRQNDLATVKADLNSITSVYAIIDPASPAYKVAPNPWQNTLLGALAGLILALGLVVVQESLDDTIKGPGDVRRFLNLRTLGMVPMFDRHETALLNPRDDKTSKIEVFRLVRTNIHYAFGGPRRKLLMVASSLQGEGKTTIALNLGIASAMEGQRVVLISADLRQPAADRRILENNIVEGDFSTGLADFLEGAATLRDVVHKTTVPGFFLIPSGRKVMSPPKLLGSERMSALLARLEESFDLVILDVPATLPIVDATVVADKVDGCVLVVAAHQTEREIALQTLERLHHVGARVMGVLLNKVPSQSGGAYYSYYGNSGYGYN